MHKYAESYLGWTGGGWKVGEETEEEFMML
jgi:hypothetical protein